MLVITRRLQEGIVLESNEGNESVEIKILGVKGNQVRIGIGAPPEIEVHRKEVYERNQQAEAQGRDKFLAIFYGQKITEVK